MSAYGSLWQVVQTYNRYVETILFKANAMTKFAFTFWFQSARLFRRLSHKF
jgi:hypothetical protein